MKKYVLLLLFGFVILSCQKAKETVNKSGEIVGKSATEFIGGVSEGIDKSLECELILSEDLKQKQISTGKFFIEDGQIGKSNKLVVYFIFEEDFSNEVSFKVNDKKGLETGRAKILIEGKKGEASYFDVPFDNRTIIESKSKIYIN